MMVVVIGAALIDVVMQRIQSIVAMICFRVIRNFVVMVMISKLGMQCAMLMRLKSLGIRRAVEGDAQLDRDDQILEETLTMLPHHDVILGG
jgi:hypothetical protein